MSKHKVGIILLTLSAFSLFVGCLILLLEIQVYTPETDGQVEQMMNSTIILPCNDSKLQMCMTKSVPAVTLFLQLMSFEFHRNNSTIDKSDRSGTCYLNPRSIKGDHLRWKSNTGDSICNQTDGLSIPSTGIMLIFNILQMKSNHKTSDDFIVHTIKRGYTTLFTKWVNFKHKQREVFESSYFFMAVRLEKDQTIEASLSDVSLLYPMKKTNVFGFYGIS
ncbi:unnamed protein product [Mytilus edulis]|uniref:TNF family profile domain-containing protein n=1 Tax=Mytilus edulis TaxID=6550 RepID=A0A8S3TTI8_MYTED|nr:unnamed protein product [Mytilus edulis]